VGEVIVSSLRARAIGCCLRAEGVAVGFAAVEAGADFGPVAVGDGGVQALEFVLETAECAEDFVAVLLEDLDPHGRVARGDAGGVAQAVAGEIAPGGIFLREERAEARRDGLGEVADVGDDFVVFVGCDGADFAAEIAPEAGDGVGGFGVSRGGAGERGDEADAFVEEVGAAVFPAGFLAAGHGVRADEKGGCGRRGVAGAGEFAFDAADVGDDRASGEGGGDLAGELDDFFDGGGEDDEGRVADGFLGRVGDGVAPRLFLERETSLGAAGPDDDAAGDAAGAGGHGDGTAEQAGGEDGELVEHDAS
jgi:hypothetical protein